MAASLRQAISQLKAWTTLQTVWTNVSYGDPFARSLLLQGAQRAGTAGPDVIMREPQSFLAKGSVRLPQPFRRFPKAPTAFLCRNDDVPFLWCKNVQQWSRNRQFANHDESLRSGHGESLGFTDSPQVAATPPECYAAFGLALLATACRAALRCTAYTAATAAGTAGALSTVDSAQGVKSNMRTSKVNS